MMNVRHVLYALLTSITLMGSVSGIQAQAAGDSVLLNTPAKKEKKGSIFSGRPGKSLLMSLVVPGAGQFYNKSYLRIPFVYAAVGGMGYVLFYNTRQYNCLKDAYIANVDGVPHTVPDHCPAVINQITDGSTLKLLRDRANADRQLAIVGFSLVWLANGIDAFVDAHLKDFDIGDDLTLEIGTRFDDDAYVPMRVGIYVQF